MSNHKINLLFVVTLPPPEGGIRVLFGQLVRDLQNDPRVNVLTVDLGTHKKFFSKPFILFYRLIEIFVKSAKADIITFQTPWNYVSTAGVYTYLISRLRGIPIIFRQSAGNNHLRFQNMWPWVRYIVKRTILQSEICFFETQFQVQFFKTICRNRVLWFANNRPPVKDKQIPDRVSAKKFLFFSQVSKEKGVHIAIEAFKKLQDRVDVFLDIYGHDVIGVEKLIGTAKNIRYCGLARNDDKYKIFKKYDALILPTDWAGEGHPGVIMEAFMMEMPVIVSNKQTLMEFIKDGENGLVVPINDSDALAMAVLRLHNDSELYKKISQKISAIKSEFSSPKWTEIFIQHLEELVNHE